MGRGGQPFEVCLQVLEEIAARWAAVAVAVSAHSLSSHPLLAFGTDEQKCRWLPGMLSGAPIFSPASVQPKSAVLTMKLGAQDQPAAPTLSAPTQVDTSAGSVSHTGPVNPPMSWQRQDMDWTKA